MTKTTVDARRSPEPDMGPARLADARAAAFSEFVRQLPFAAALLDRDLRLLAVSREWVAHGLAPDLKPGVDARRTLVAAEETLALMKCAQEGDAFSRYLPAMDPDGVQHIWRTEFSACRDEGEEPYAVMVTARDVTGYAEATLRAERDQHRLRMALELDGLLVREFDLKTRELLFSGATPELRSGAGSTAIRWRSSTWTIATASPPWSPVASRARRGSIEFRLNRDDGVETWVRSASKVLVGPDGRPERLVNLFKDITDRRRQTEAVETLAFKDTLTDLPNRALFQHRFQEAVSASELLGEMFGLIMIDVDHFKDINDTLGHDAGDALLKRLADMLRHAFRADDTVARLGGDEFAVILRGLHCEADMLRPIQTLQGCCSGRSSTAGAASRSAPASARPCTAIWTPTPRTWSRTPTSPSIGPRTRAAIAA
jgi:diguanylate cyclase (GGDEF)-like protein